ncbi:MAG: hypothetical protein R2759_04195 [Bacteroidales bacterium]
MAKSQNAPVAVNDTIVFATGMEPDSDYTFNLLVNDYDPDGFAIEIDSIFQVADKATLQEPVTLIMLTVFLQLSARQEIFSDF